LQIDAPSRTGGHGDTLDDGTIDEAFSQDDDTVEAGMRPSMATRKNAQLWVISTAGDGRSLYLWRKVLAGRAAHEAGQHGRTCYVEYSAPDDADPGDPVVWWGCMPALGITISEDFIRGEWERALRKGPEGIDMFRRAYLNQWPVIPSLPEEVNAQALPLEVWEQLVDQSAERGATPAFGVAMAQDRSWAAIATAWRRPDGLVQTLLLDYHAGTAWLPGRVAELRGRWGGTVTVDTVARGVITGASEPSQQVQAQAHNHLADLIGSRGVRHGGEAPLMVALRAARWRGMGDTRLLDRKSSTDITPLIATALAVHATSNAPVGGWMVGLP
jgi:hypothetical protein